MEVEYKGLKLLMDEEDVALLEKYNWVMRQAYNGKLSLSQEKLKKIDGHRKRLEHKKLEKVIMKGAGRDIFIHINGNALDYRKCNLRKILRSELMMKAVYKKNRIGIQGVYYDEKNNRYEASIGNNGKNICLGHFLKPEEASYAYMKAKESIINGQEIDMECPGRIRKPLGITGIRGITRKRDKYEARAYKNKKIILCGSYKTLEEAIEARDKALKKLEISPSN